MPEGYLPYFQGVITPISTPVEIKYHPSHNSFQVWTIETAKMSELDICELFLIGQPLERMACIADVETHGDKIETAREERTVMGSAVVLRSGEKLVWTIESLELTIDGKQWRPSLPINHIRVVSDSNGRASEIEVSFPALEEAGVQDIPTPGKKSYRQVVNLFKQSLLPLPDKAIMTGYILYSLPVSEMVAEMLAFWGEQDEQEVVGAVEAEQDNLNYRIKGWGYVKNKKVLVAELSFTGSVKIHGKPMHINNVGYVLLDADKGHILQRENLSLMSYGKSQFKISYKFTSEASRN